MTTRRRRIERLCSPALVVSVCLAVATAPTTIWADDSAEVLYRVLGSGFVLAATREPRDEPT